MSFHSEHFLPPTSAFLAGKDTEQLFSIHPPFATNNFTKFYCVLSLPQAVFSSRDPGYTVLPDTEGSTLKPWSPHFKRIS